MAVTSCVEIARGRDGSFDARNRGRRYKRTFIVLTDSKLDGPATVKSYMSLPSEYGTYTSGNDADTAALVESINVKPAGFCRWEVEVSYSTVTPNEAQNAENPVDRAPTVRWNFQAYQRPCVSDVDGSPIVNSAGDPFSPPLEREEKRPLLSVSRFENMFSPGMALAYQYAVNSDTFMGVDPGYCRCNGIQAELHYEKNQYCWKVEYEFEFRKEGFTVQVLDQGFRKLRSGTPETMRDRQGTPLSSPGLLNGQGGQLSECYTAIETTAPGPTDTFIEVADIDVFPDAPFVVKIGNEIIYVGAKEDIAPSPIISELLRGYRGTTAEAHAIAAVVQMEPVYLGFDMHESLPFADLNIII